MGIISITNTDRLLWLGRYSERVYTTVRLFSNYFDSIIDKGDEGIAELCKRLDIPDIYPDGETFVERYCFDLADPNSIASNLDRAYDNAINLRELIGSEAVSYIQLAVYELEKAHGNRAPLIGMQKILDNILAFWGIIDDMIPSENVRNIIKTGKRIERLDLYSRLEMPYTSIKREIHRLTDRIKKTNLKFNPEKLELLSGKADEQDPDWPAILVLVDGLLEG